MLEKADPPIRDGVDPQNNAKSALLHRHSHKDINNLTLNQDGALGLLFDQNREIILITSTSIVDWHWCLNRSGQAPYHDYIVACFKAGKSTFVLNPSVNEPLGQNRHNDIVPIIKKAEKVIRKPRQRDKYNKSFQLSENICKAFADKIELGSKGFRDLI